MTRLQRTRPEGPGPFRSCVACRRIENPSALLRICLDEQGVVVVSHSGPGRGAWLCRETSRTPIADIDAKVPGDGVAAQPECLARLNDKMIARALRTSTEGRLAQLRNALSVAV